ncbi:DUF5384 family protein [Xenorhabdus innexi]|uniref:DUF5384 family protein n=1 Tax=Xenorhabdus innexi TaxID=290109 RepID=UPI000B35D520|nr:DUF5384 family protein [Xenorhabdus innexi]
MKKILISSLLISLSLPVFASSLQEQMFAIAQAENEGKAEEQKQLAERQAQQEKAAKAERERKQREAAARTAKIRKQEAAREAEKQRILAEAAADKKRDQNYEDELRKLDLEMKKLELEKRTARVKRENEFIDQELKKEAAKTDVIQSDADVKRNLSSGTKSLLESVGKASEKEASGWFK